MSPRSHLINTCEHIRPREKSRGARKKELRSGEYLLWQAELLAEGLWQPSRIRPSPARFSTPSACPRGHPRSLPLAGTDTSKSPNCDGQAERLRPGVPLTRPCFRPCTTMLRQCSVFKFLCARKTPCTERYYPHARIRVFHHSGLLCFREGKPRSFFLCFAKQLRGLQEPAKVITGSEDEELLLILVPIGAEAAKHGGSVIQSVREHAEFHLGIRNNSAVMEDEIWQWHGFTSVDQSITRTGSGTGWRST